jgi:hypothetical protein
MKKQLFIFTLIIISIIIAGGISTKAKKYPANYNFVLSGSLDSNFRASPDSVAMYVVKSQRFIDSIAAAEERVQAWAGAEDNSTLAAALDSTKALQTAIETSFRTTTLTSEDTTFVGGTKMVNKTGSYIFSIFAPTNPYGYNYIDMISTGGVRILNNMSIAGKLYGNRIVLTDTLFLSQYYMKFNGKVHSYGDFATDDIATNTFLGVGAGNANTSGSSNTYIGSSAGLYNTTVSANVGVGVEALKYSGINNSAVGLYALRGTSGSTASNNSALGYLAGNNITTGIQNIFIGSSPTATKTTAGSNNIIIGFNIGADTATDSYDLKIGNSGTYTIEGDLLNRTVRLLNDTESRTFYVEMKSDSVLFIARKYNASYDIVYKFENCGNNKLFTCDSVDLKSNTAQRPLTTVSRASAVNIIRQTATDYFPAPMQIRTSGAMTTAWVGGNHKDPTATYRTAKTDTYELWAGELELKSGMRLWTDEIKIRTKNIFWNPIKLPTRNEILQEYCDFKIKGNTIEYSNQHTVDSTMFVYDYYGMQFMYQSTCADSVYFAHSDSTHWRVFRNGISSGTMAAYPKLEKVMLKQSDKSIVTQIWLDNNYGLPADTLTYIKDNTLAWKAALGGGKLYFRLMEDVTINAGSRYGFRGSYSFSDMSAQTAPQEIASGLMYCNGKPVMYSDVKSTIVTTIPRQLSGAEFDTLSVNTGTISFDGFFVLPARNYKVNATGYGNLYYRMK